MWWFLKSRAERQADLDAGFSARRGENWLLDVVPDLRPRLDGNDTALKIWLPQAVARTVKWLADYDGDSQSAWLRALLVRYLYGRVAVAAQQMRQTRVSERLEAPAFLRKQADRASGRWVYRVPQLGKNTVAFKLWLPAQMRSDLTLLADHAQVRLSPFVREVIISDLLGHGSLPERPQIIGQPGAAALAWERDEAVPVAEIEEQDYDGVGAAERHWVDA